VTWGVLTLATPASTASSTNPEDTVVASTTPTPAPTSGASRLPGVSGRRRTLAAALGVVVMGFILA
jgi:hypothetical protein